MTIKAQGEQLIAKLKSEFDLPDGWDLEFYPKGNRGGEVKLLKPDLRRGVVLARHSKNFVFLEQRAKEKIARRLHPGGGNA